MDGEREREEGEIEEGWRERGNGKNDLIITHSQELNVVMAMYPTCPLNTNTFKFHSFHITQLSTPVMSSNMESILGRTD